MTLSHRWHYCILKKSIHNIRSSTLVNKAHTQDSAASEDETDHDGTLAENAFEKLKDILAALIDKIRAFPSFNARDAEFEESKHPRRTDGKFGTGSEDGKENFKESQKPVDKAVQVQYSNILSKIKSSDGITINSISRHALQRATERHINAYDVKYVLQHDTEPGKGNDDSTRCYEEKGLRVVLNFKIGKIVSVMRRSGHGKLKR